MKRIKTFDEFINESVKESKLLADIFKEAKKSRNFSIVEMRDDLDKNDWRGSVVYIKSKLKGDTKYHKDDLDEFEIGLDANDDVIILHYIPSGYTEEISSLKEFKDMTRA